jgi:hypothetical protein
MVQTRDIAQEEGSGMSEAVVRWRPALFRFAIGFMAIDLAFYLCGVVFVNISQPVDEKIRAGAWLFLIGSVLSLIALLLSMFGHGWKRIGLAVVCLLSLPFWYGFTLY